MPIILGKNEIEFLFSETKQNVLELSIDLEKKEIIYNQKCITFEVEKHLIDRIIFGLDDIDITFKDKDKIINFEKNRISSRPWIFK